jgi:hypothetical protein
MSFVDHLAALHLLEQRSIDIPSNELIELSLIAVKHSASHYFPWNYLKEAIRETCQNGSADNPIQSKEMIIEIEEHIKKFGVTNTSKVIKNFHTLLAHSHGKKAKPSSHNYPRFLTTVHCESSLAAILCLLHDDGQNNANLRKVFQACPSSRYSSSFFLTCDLIQIEDNHKRSYKISVSKFCCPVCWELLQVLNDLNKNVEFVVRAHHSHLYPVCLPPCLPNCVLEKMIKCFREKLYKKLRQLPSVSKSDSEVPPYVPGHYKKLSLESAGESIVSSAKSSTGNSMNEDLELYGGRD